MASQGATYNLDLDALRYVSAPGNSGPWTSSNLLILPLAALCIELGMTADSVVRSGPSQLRISSPVHIRYCGSRLWRISRPLRDGSAATVRISRQCRPATITISMRWFSSPSATCLGKVRPNWFGRNPQPVDALDANWHGIARIESADALRATGRSSLSALCFPSPVSAGISSQSLVLWRSG